MMHARLFMGAHKYRDSNIQPTRKSLRSSPEPVCLEEPAEPFLDGNPSCDRPFFVQFCANSPDELLGAAKYVEAYCDAVDLNLGCPQGIAKKGNYGAFLQEDWDTIYKMINNLHKHLSIPVTAKMRVLETKEKTLEYAQMILSAGASLIAVHGRQRDQKGHKTGLADWTVIRYLRDHLPPDTVIFANGNILCYNDIQKCLEATGADGIMSAEGNLCDPTIFAPPPRIGEEGREYWRGRDGRGGYRMDAVFRRYMDIIHKYVLEHEPPQRRPLFLPSDSPLDKEFPPSPRVSEEDGPPNKKHKKGHAPKPPPSPSLGAMQPHLFHLLRPLISTHTHIRDALARTRPGDIETYESILSMVEDATASGLRAYASDPGSFDGGESSFSYTADLSAEEQKLVEGKVEGVDTSLRTRKAVKRPWWVCQPYVRPLPIEAVEKGSLKVGKKEMKRIEQERGHEQVQDHQQGEREGNGGRAERIVIENIENQIVREADGDPAPPQQHTEEAVGTLHGSITTRTEERVCG